MCRLGLMLRLGSVWFDLLALTVSVHQVSPSADVVYIRYKWHLHNVVYIINLLHTTPGCVYNIGVLHNV